MTHRSSMARSSALLRAPCCLALLVALALSLASPAPVGAGEDADRMAEMFGGKQFGRGKDEKAPAVKADIPFIRCETCELLVSRLLDAAAKKRQEGTAIRLHSHESEIMEDLEAVCDPDSDNGEWISSMDLQEKGSRLRLVPMGEQGECGTECRTIARACDSILEDADVIDLGQALWKSCRRSDLVSQKWALSDLLCKEMTDACAKKTPPPLPKDRAPGPGFKPMSEEDAKLSKTMRAMRKAGLGGTLFNKDEILKKQGRFGGEGDGDEPELAGEL